MNAVLDPLAHRVKETRASIQIGENVMAMRVEGDEILIEQVLLNIRSNAMDCVEEADGHDGRIHIGRDTEAHAVLVISDAGIGLRGLSGAELIDSSFTPKDIGKGLGLGLPIVFNVMQDMGRQLGIMAGDSGGAKVLMRLQDGEGESVNDAPNDPVADRG